MGQHKHNQHSEHQYEEDPQDILADETGKRGIIGSVITILLIVAVLGSWWYGFGKSYAAVKSAAVSAKSGIASVLHISKADTADGVLTEELSTNGSLTSDSVSSSSWEIRKSVAGDSIWKIYAQNVQAQGNVAFQHQVINGLKNITILKNNISQDKLAHNSMTQGQEYSFLNKDMQEKFAGKVAEANKQLQEGKHLKDMNSSLLLAYQLANAPSNSFVYSLSMGDIQNLLE